MKFHVWHNGDRSVGINGERATVEIDVEQYTSDEDRNEYIREIKVTLIEAFTGLWDFKAYVMTEDEIQEENKAFLRMEQHQEEIESGTFEGTII